MSNIVTFNNNLYRIGDIIDNDNIEIYQYIKNNPHLSNSFISKFISKTYNICANKYKRINIAADIIKSMINDNNKSPNDTLVIHLRLGDVMNVQENIFEKNLYETIIKPRIPDLNFLLSQINKSTLSEWVRVSENFIKVLNFGTSFADQS